MMKTKSLNKVILILACLSLAITLISGIYMAQPWGDNYAYQKPGGYLSLFLFLAWACSPYLLLMLVSRNTSASMALTSTRLLGALIICIGGIFILTDIAFFNTDAQGGLVFIFLPIYQWALLFLVEVIGRVIGYAIKK